MMGSRFNLTAMILAAACALPTFADDVECAFFGPQRERRAKEIREQFARSTLTEQVTRTRGIKGTASHRAANYDAADSGNLIDKHIYTTLRDAGVTPAERTDDYEFIRRVTLDLTGRVPAAARVQAFLASTDVNKRSQLVDELLGKTEWVDKWTMYFGDRLENTARKTQVQMYEGGRNAFYEWIKGALASRKPYDRFVREIIAARGANSHDPAQGAVNWLVGGRVTMGPQQDIWDQQISNVSETFLGISSINCILCHNGRGHLENLNLWGRGITRYQAWQLASFLSHSNQVATPVDPAVPNGARYYSIIDDVQQARNLDLRIDYTLNTAVGNRPPRQPVGGQRLVPPEYIFTGAKPEAGENYRDALARFVTTDFQFARAAVNYIWAEFFGRGIVHPLNQFDLARLDPDNPPPSPWTLQPSHPALLKELAQTFIEHGYDLRYLMKVITTSEAYQMSSRYPGEWNPSWEPLFARHLVRRLWGEEIIDAVSQTSGIPQTYTVGAYRFNWAMQSPEPTAIIGRANALLASFNPGNRDDQPRNGDGAIQQALAMMNDAQIMTRTRASGAGANASLLARLLPLTNEDLVNSLYLTVLSRPPSDSERATALAALGQGTRQQRAEDLLWSLYNKVDFLFNY